MSIYGYLVRFQNTAPEPSKAIEKLLLKAIRVSSAFRFHVISKIRFSQLEVSRTVHTDGYARLMARKAVCLGIHPEQRPWGNHLLRLHFKRGIEGGRANWSRTTSAQEEVQLLGGKKCINKPCLGLVGAYMVISMGNTGLNLIVA